MFFSCFFHFDPLNCCFLVSLALYAAPLKGVVFSRYCIAHQCVTFDIGPNPIMLTCSSPCGTGAAAAAASAASSSSCAPGTSPGPRRRCWSAQSPLWRRSRPRCQPQTCWSLRSGTGGRCLSPLKVWRGRSCSSCAGGASPGRSRRCGTHRCWTGRLRTAPAEACPWRRRLTGSWCCPVAPSVRRTGASEGSSGGSALRSSPGSCWGRPERPLGLLLWCCAECKRRKEHLEGISDCSVVFTSVKLTYFVLNVWYCWMR